MVREAGRVSAPGGWGSLCAGGSERFLGAGISRLGGFEGDVCVWVCVSVVVGEAIIL